MKTQIEKLDRLIREIEMDEYLNEETLPKIREAKGLLNTLHEQCNIADVVEQSEQLSLSDFRVGFEYEELQMDSERYLNKGVIWVKKTYGLNSPRLHKIQKLLDEGKLRKA